MTTDAGRLKHLEFIQQVITRLSNNSFLLKGWSVTIITALLALAIKEQKSKDFIIFALVPCIMFWGLDGYFLHQERLYRRLWIQICTENQDTPTNFIMKPSIVDAKNECWFCLLFSKTLLIFHGTLALILIAAYKLIQ